jgi:hypothetical protein
VTIGVAQQNRPGRIEAVEVLARELRTARRERLGEEIACVEPDVAALVLGLVGAAEASFELRENQRDGPALVAEVAVGVPRAVKVPVDDARHDHASLEIGHPGCRSRTFPSLLTGADEGDPSVADRNRLLESRGARTLVTLGPTEDQDPPIEKDRVRRRRG